MNLIPTIQRALKETWSVTALVATPLSGPTDMASMGRTPAWLAQAGPIAVVQLRPS